MKRILITIPTFNAGQHVVPCLASIRNALSFAEGEGFSAAVAVIDDGSTDDTAALVKAFDNVMLITGTGDWWWSGSINRGVAFAQEQNFDYVMLLNADNTLPPHFFSAAYRALAAKPGAVIGSRVFDADGKIYFQGCNIDGMGQLRYVGSAPDAFTPCEVFGGMGVFVPVSAFGRVGVFDEKNFPLYFGDTDFWLRCKRNGIAAFVGPHMQVTADLKNTGIKRSGKGTMHLLKNLFNIRFHANLKTVSRFYFKNFSLPRSLAAFVLFYLNSLRTGK